MPSILSQCFEFSFNKSYAYADLVRREILCEYSIHDPTETASCLEDQILKPQKHTLLHDYIEAIIADDIHFNFSGPGWDYDCVEPVFELLNGHDIEYETLDDYIVNMYRDDHTGESIVPTDEHREKYKVEYALETLEDVVQNTVVPILVTEVFTLLFSDREAMKEFNLKVTQLLGAVKHKRCTYWNSWLRNALMYREKGVCVLCKTDLTSTFNSLGKVAVDHIVPIALGGVNDPTNLQLLCSDCNGKKSGDKVVTSNVAPLYWNET
jgi:5-methylcytosine-specific restriction endonuclease McrA